MTKRASHLSPAAIAAEARAFFDLPGVEQAFLVAAFALAPWASVAVRGVQLRTLLASMSRLPLARTQANAPGIERGETLVRRAFRRSGSDPRCLPEAVVQYVLHLRAGPAPKLVVGVRRAPAGAPGADRSWELAAHAWVEEDEGPRREPGFSPILELSSTRGLGQAA